MDVLCNWLGHRLKDGHREVVTAQRFFGNSANPIGPPTYKWRVSIKCERCGYEHARDEAMEGKASRPEQPE